MAAAIVRATRDHVVVYGKISLKDLARLIDLSKQSPPVISEIEINGVQPISITDPDHATKDYFKEPIIDAFIKIEDWRKNVKRDSLAQTVTVDTVTIT